MGTVHALIRRLRRAVRRAMIPPEAPALRPATGAPPLRLRHTHRDDAPIAAALLQWHARLNAERFGGALREIPVRVSRRMRGHYARAQRGAKPEIAISHWHLRRHGLAQAVETLLHEMVHQWQDESGLPLDHGAAFRGKAREVGIRPRATRVVD